MKKISIPVFPEMKDLRKVRASAMLAARSLGRQTAKAKYSLGKSLILAGGTMCGFTTEEGK